MTKVSTLRLASEAGYNLTELMVVVALAGILTGTAVIQIGTTRAALNGDGAMRTLMAQMNTARELAITQRRNMRLVFDANNRVQLIREEVPGPTLTTLSSTLLEGGLQYQLIAGLPDTPDAFGNASAVQFGAATELTFQPDGTFVDQSGGSLNGTVFLAIPGQKMSARAVTVLGSTGRVRGYRWDGRNWKLV
jgi:prepilin-type N-terminal cleavage/methylation domain-containing protein